jgi:hypothetical protein
LSAPKKGKDLSALKARLAKKAAATDGGDPAPTATPQVPAPGEVQAAVPAPGEVKAPVADIPAPGQVKPPADIPAPGEVNIPAPGEVLQPQPDPVPAAAAPAPAPAKQDIADDPMSGGVAFDPDMGLIDDVGGEIKPRGGAGLPLFAGIIGIVVGVGLGWMGHKSSDSRARVDSAKKKAAVIQAKVNEIEENRALISLKVGEAQDALEAKDGDKAVAALEELEPTFVELGDVFGWQMAAMDGGIIKSIFDLADASNRLQLNVGILKGWVGANKEVLAKKISGPSSFVVVRGPNGAGVLAEYVSAICEEIPEEPPEDFNPDALKKCEGEEILKANAYMVRTSLGGEVSMFPATSAWFLNPGGQMYLFAIGATPEANAKSIFDLNMGQLKDGMDSMVKLKERASEGISNYTNDPPVDGG